MSELAGPSKALQGAGDMHSISDDYLARLGHARTGLNIGEWNDMHWQTRDQHMRDALEEYLAEGVQTSDPNAGMTRGGETPTAAETGETLEDRVKRIEGVLGLRRGKPT